MDRSAFPRRIVAPIGMAMILVALVAASPAAAASGPYLVKDINTSGSSSPIELTEMNGILYFNAKGGGKGRELWRSDGTSDGTRRVKDIRPGSGGGSPWDMAAIDGRLYFSADDGVNGRELWISDGTGSGTRLVKDINPGPGHSYPWGFTALNGVIYFNADDGASGRELWRTDGTPGGTYRLKDIRAGSVGSGPSAFVRLGNKVFFETTSCPTGGVDCVSTLYQTDGTAAGTKVLKDSAGRKITGQIAWLRAIGSRLFFSFNETQLWRSNGTSSTTKRIADVPAWEITGVGSRAFFRAGEQLWRSDGTSASTVMVRDFPNSGVDNLNSLNGKLFFFADRQPWTSDGTTAGTQPVGKHVQADTGFAVLGSVIYFGGFGGEEDLAAARPTGVGPSFVPAPTLTLWRSDGTHSGTYSVGPPDAHMHSPTAAGNSIFFAADADGYGTELWRYVP